MKELTSKAVDEQRLAMGNNEPTGFTAGGPMLIVLFRLKRLVP